MSHPHNDAVMEGVLDFAIEKGLTVDEAAKLYDTICWEAAYGDNAFDSFSYMGDDYSDLN